MRLADIDFSNKTAMFYMRDLPREWDHYAVCRDEHTYLSELHRQPRTDSDTKTACAYYHKLVVYLNRFGNHMPDTLRLTLLREIEDSVYG